MDNYTPNGSQVCSTGIVKTLFTENKFTSHDCWVEIYQNSDDAESKEMIVGYIKHEVNKNDSIEFLMISDNGCGMTMGEIDNSLNLLKRGSKNGEKHGKFNFGGKAAILQFSGIADYILSGDKDYTGICIVQSKSKDSQPVCYEMVGKELIEKGWAGTVQPKYLDSGSESVKCSKLWEKYPIRNTGTNIFIQLTQSMKDELKENHEEKWVDLQLACNERLNHCKLTIYTPENLKCELLYKPIIDKENIIPQKFFSIPIKVYEKDGKYLFVVVFKELVKGSTNKIEYITFTKIIKPHGNTKWKQELETIEEKKTLKGYTHIGEFKMEIGCNFTYKIDEDYKDDKSNNDIYMVRNGFCLNHFNNPYCDKKTRSGDFYIRRIWKNMKSTISYNTSENGDKLDKIIGINMHKADIKWQKLPINLGRTIEGVMHVFGDKVVKYIQKVEYNPPNCIEKLSNGDTSLVPKYKINLHKKNVCDKWKKYKRIIPEIDIAQSSSSDEEEEEEYYTDNESIGGDIPSTKPPVAPVTPGPPVPPESSSDDESDDVYPEPGGDGGGCIPEPLPEDPTPPETRIILKEKLNKYYSIYENNEDFDKQLINLLDSFMDQ